VQTQTKNLTFLPREAAMLARS